MQLTCWALNGLTCCTEASVKIYDRTLVKMAVYISVSASPQDSSAGRCCFRLILLSSKQSPRGQYLLLDILWPFTVSCYHPRTSHTPTSSKIAHQRHRHYELDIGSVYHGPGGAYRFASQPWVWWTVARPDSSPGAI